MGIRLLAALLVLGAVACGSSSDSFSCLNGPVSACVTFTISGATFTSKDCGTAATPVSACPTIGLLGRCIVSGLAGPSGACPSGATCASIHYIYFRFGVAGDGQAECTALGGSWNPI